MNQVYRCYTEKREGFQVEAGSLLRDLRDQLGITGLTRLRILCRYDSQGVSPEIDAIARQSWETAPYLPWSLSRVSTISGPIPAPSASES